MPGILWCHRKGNTMSWLIIQWNTERPDRRIAEVLYDPDADQYRIWNYTTGKYEPKKESI